MYFVCRGEMNTLDLAMKNVVLKKASGTNGGEWQGPCPACGGDDRFHVWPEQNEGKGAYWCRGCGKTGDNIQYLRDFCGLSFRDACAELRIDLPAGRNDFKTPPPQRTKPVFAPVSHASPADLWQEHAGKLVAWAQGCIENNQEILVWLAARGINHDAVVSSCLGWNPGETGKDLYRPRKSWGLPEILKADGRPKALCIPRGLVIPYISGGIIQRIRIRRPEHHRTEQWPAPYYVLPGSAMPTMLLGRERRAFVVVESELDAIACCSGNSLAGAVALGSVSAKPDAETFAVLQGALQILNALDFDAAGKQAMAWWAEHFPRCKRWPAPKGKDPGDAVRLGIDLEGWIKGGLPPALTICAPKTGENGKTGRPTAASKGSERPTAASKTSDHVAGVGQVIDVAEAAPAFPVRSEPIERAPAAGQPITNPPGDDGPLSPPLRELYLLLRNNPTVRIINTATRYTVLRNGRYVGGRINELVFRDQECMKYLANHPAEEIHAGNYVV